MGLPALKELLGISHGLISQWNFKTHSERLSSARPMFFSSEKGAIPVESKRPGPISIQWCDFPSTVQLPKPEWRNSTRPWFPPPIPCLVKSQPPHSTPAVRMQELGGHSCSRCLSVTSGQYIAHRTWQNLKSLDFLSHIETACAPPPF